MDFLVPGEGYLGYDAYTASARDTDDYGGYDKRDAVDACASDAYVDLSAGPSLDPYGKRPASPIGVVNYNSESD